MAEQSGFFDAQMVEGRYDRTYVASFFARYFASFIGNGVFHHGEALVVTQLESPAMKVKVGTGQGWVNGYWYENTSSLELQLEESDETYARKDIVVLQLNLSTREMKVIVKTGTPAATPVEPELSRDSDLYELKLAVVSIGASAISVVQSNIEDTRLNSSVCGYVTGVVDQLDTTTFALQLQDYIDTTVSTVDDWVSSFETTTIEQRDQIVSALNAYIAQYKIDLQAVIDGDRQRVNALITSYTNTLDAWVTNFETTNTARAQALIDELNEMISEAQLGDVLRRIGALETGKVEKPDTSQQGALSKGLLYYDSDADETSLMSPAFDDKMDIPQYIIDDPQHEETKYQPNSGLVFWQYDETKEDSDTLLISPNSSGGSGFYEFFVPIFDYVNDNDSGSVFAKEVPIESATTQKMAYSFFEQDNDTTYRPNSSFGAGVIGANSSSYSNPNTCPSSSLTQPTAGTYDGASVNTSMCFYGGLNSRFKPMTKDTSSGDSGVDTGDWAYAISVGELKGGDSPLLSRFNPCVVDPETEEVVYYLNKEDFRYKKDGTLADLTGADGDVMIEIKPIWYRKIFDIRAIGDKSYNSLVWQFSVKEPKADEFGSWVCANEYNGVLYDNIYVGAYASAKRPSGNLDSAGLPQSAVSNAGSDGGVSTLSYSSISNVSWGAQSYGGNTTYRSVAGSNTMVRPLYAVCYRRICALGEYGGTSGCPAYYKQALQNMPRSYTNYGGRANEQAGVYNMGDQCGQTISFDSVQSYLSKLGEDYMVTHYKVYDLLNSLACLFFKGLGASSLFGDEVNGVSGSSNVTGTSSKYGMFSLKTDHNDVECPSFLGFEGIFSGASEMMGGIMGFAKDSQVPRSATIDTFSSYEADWVEVLSIEDLSLLKAKSYVSSSYTDSSYYSACRSSFVELYGEDAILTAKDFGLFNVSYDKPFRLHELTSVAYGENAYDSIYGVGFFNRNIISMPASNRYVSSFYYGFSSSFCFYSGIAGNFLKRRPGFKDPYCGCFQDNGAYFIDSDGYKKDVFDVVKSNSYIQQILSTKYAGTTENSPYVYYNAFNSPANRYSYYSLYAYYLGDYRVQEKNNASYAKYARARTGFALLCNGNPSYMSYNTAYSNASTSSLSVMISFPVNYAWNTSVSSRQYNNVGKKYEFLDGFKGFGYPAIKSTSSGSYAKYTSKVDVSSSSQNELLLNRIFKQDGSDVSWSFRSFSSGSHYISSGNWPDYVSFYSYSAQCAFNEAVRVMMVK